MDIKITEKSLKKNNFELIKLTVGNLIPLFGVIFLSWSMISILVYYWFELVFIVILSMIRIIFFRNKRITQMMKNYAKNPKEVLPGNGGNWLFNFVMALIFGIPCFVLLFIPFMTFITVIDTPKNNFNFDFNKIFQIILFSLPLLIINLVDLIKSIKKDKEINLVLYRRIFQDTGLEVCKRGFVLVSSSFYVVFVYFISAFILNFVVMNTEIYTYLFSVLTVVIFVLIKIYVDYHLFFKQKGYEQFLNIFSNQGNNQDGNSKN